jgi:hypothetical protein
MLHVSDAVALAMALATALVDESTARTSAVEAKCQWIGTP